MEPIITEVLKTIKQQNNLNLIKHIFSIELYKKSSTKYLQKKKQKQKNLTKIDKTNHLNMIDDNLLII